MPSSLPEIGLAQLRSATEQVLTSLNQEKSLKDAEQTLNRWIKSFGSDDRPTNPESGEHPLYDDLGTLLWNGSIRLERQGGDSEIRRVTLALSRVLAFFILDYAQQGIERLTENCLRILRLSLRTAKGCIEISLLDHAAAVLQLAARYQDDLAHGTAALSAEHRALHDDLSCEYYLNRMALSWRQDRLDLAEHLFKKAIMARDIWTASTAEQFADLLYEIGRALSKQESTEESVNWFRKSAFVFELETLSDCNVSAAELKMTVMQALVKALLHVETPEALGEARSVLETIRSSFGAKLSCHLLEFDFHAHCPESSSEDMLQAILIMIQGVSLNDPSYRTIMRCIYDLKSKDTALAARALEHLLLSRVLATGREEWIEQVVTVRLWMLAPPGSATACDLAENLILSVDQAIDVPFSANATSMLHGILWKMIEAATEQGHHSTAVRWCRLALNPVFERCGPLNQAKLQRKEAQCHIALHDPRAAITILKSMSDSAGSEVPSLFLLLKAALLSGDEALAQDSLRRVCQSRYVSSGILSSFSLAAQESGNRALAMTSMLALIRRDEQEESDGKPVNWSILYRCTMQLLTSEMDTSHEERPDDAGTACLLVERAAAHAKSTQTDTEGSTVAATLVIDLDWWIRQSYNLALRRSKAWSSLVAIRLMQSCFAFIHIRESKFRPSQSETDRLLGIRLNGSFLCCLHLVVLARSEDHIESQLQFYLNLRSHASSYRRHVQDHWNEPVRSAATLGEHIKKRYTTLLLLDLEAAIYLKAWHSLRTIIDELVLSSSTQTPNAFAAVADLILASRAPAAELLSTLQYMVQTLSSLDHPRPLSKTQLARWIRCLVHTALQCDPEAAERVLAQIPEIAADNCLPSPSQILRRKREGADIVAHQADSLIYPQEELEWLVAAVWNRAIDLFCTNDKVAFNRWADLAVGIATTMNDQGRMADHLRTNRAGLAFSEEEGIIP